MRALLQDRGLERQGRKHELIDRLLASDAAAAGAAAAEDGGSKLIRPGDTVYFRAHHGRHMEVEHEGADVLARWEDHGDWQAFVLEKSPLVIEKSDPTIFQSGDVVFLRAHTGCYVDVEEMWVRARWDDKNDGIREHGLIIWKRDHAPGAIMAGDTVFLQASSELYVDVEHEQALARWVDEGDWQALTIEKK